MRISDFGLRIIALCGGRHTFTPFNPQFITVRIVAFRNEKEYEPVRELTTAHKRCTLIADKGLWGRGYRETLALQDVSILAPDRVRTAENLARQRRLAGLRLVIESTISNLKGQMQLEQHLARTPAGLAQRIAQRLLALTLGMPPTPSPDANPEHSSPMTDKTHIKPLAPARFCRCIVSD